MSNSQKMTGMIHRSGRKRKELRITDPGLFCQPENVVRQVTTLTPPLHDDEQQSEYARHELPFGTQTGFGSMQA
jgi:hypothetical protein